MSSKAHELGGRGGGYPQGMTSPFLHLFMALYITGPICLPRCAAVLTHILAYAFSFVTM